MPLLNLRSETLGGVLCGPNPETGGGGGVAGAAQVRLVWPADVAWSLGFVGGLVLVLVLVLALAVAVAVAGLPLFFSGCGPGAGATAGGRTGC